MTVREAFSKAFGEVPEGATCHIAVSHEYEGSTIAATTVVDGVVRYRYPQKIWGDYVATGGEPCGPDISDRPAGAFVGFFGEAYDRVVEGES
jgi:hypothetical protein